MQRRPSPGYSIVIKLEIDNKVGMFAKIAKAIGDAGGDLGRIDIVEVKKNKLVREITVNARDEEHEREICKALENLDGVKVLDVVDRTFLVHRGGKIEVTNKVDLKDRDELSRVYTPGVARVSMDIYRSPGHAYDYTLKSNTVAVITDGSAVLGLGNIGALASLPVMEGKCMLFKAFGGINAFPIGVNTQDVDEFVTVVKNVATGFGGINLEDISAPRCFEVESRLREALDIPVFHDDQHGTAIVVLAALINVGRLLKEDIRDFKVVISGAGAAGIAIAKALLNYGVKNILVCDSKGILHPDRKDMNPYKVEIAEKTNPDRIKGTLKDALKGAKVFIGVSAPNIVSPEDIAKMDNEPVVFALSNPDPEISPELALPLVRIMATGRSDYPNQINNVLAFPGLFKGWLKVRARGVDERVFLEAAKAIAYVIKDEELSEDYIIPSIFNPEVVDRVASVVAEHTKKLGLAGI